MDARRCAVDADTYGAIENSMLWWYRTAMAAAADANRTHANRAALLLNGIDAWHALTGHRAEGRKHA
jgi:hypothetical protein